MKPGSILGLRLNEARSLMAILATDTETKIKTRHRQSLSEASQTSRLPSLGAAYVSIWLGSEDCLASDWPLCTSLSRAPRLPLAKARQCKQQYTRSPSPASSSGLPASLMQEPLLVTSAWRNAIKIPTRAAMPHGHITSSDPTVSSWPGPPEQCCGGIAQLRK